MYDPLGFNSSNEGSIGVVFQGSYHGFQVPDPDLIFKRLKDDKPTGWASRYRASPIAEQWRGRPAPSARPALPGKAS